MRALSWSVAVALLLMCSSDAEAQSSPRRSGHQAWADYHILGLAPEIKARVLSLRKACGTPFAATHAFARPAYPRAPVIALHYENLWCDARGAGICRGEDCLHEIYVREGSRYRRTFHGFVREVLVAADGKVSILRDGE